MLLQVTIHPRLSGTVPIFLQRVPEKHHSSPGTPICPVLGLVSQICPDVPISAAVCLRVGGQKLAHILSVCMKGRWRPGLCFGHRWGAHDAPSDPQVGLSHPMIRGFCACP